MAQFIAVVILLTAVLVIVMNMLTEGRKGRRWARLKRQTR
jgi:hypothetical protein